MPSGFSRFDVNYDREEEKEKAVIITGSRSFKFVEEVSKPRKKSQKPGVFQVEELSNHAFGSMRHGRFVQLQPLRPVAVDRLGRGFSLLESGSAQWSP